MSLSQNLLPQKLRDVEKGYEPIPLRLDTWEQLRLAETTNIGRNPIGTSKASMETGDLYVPSNTALPARDNSASHVTASAGLSDGSIF